MAMPVKKNYKNWRETQTPIEHTASGGRRKFLVMVILKALHPSLPGLMAGWLGWLAGRLADRLTELRYACGFLKITVASNARLFALF